MRLKGLTRDVTELKRAEEHQNLLVAELDHRVKNALACVSAIAQRSREGGPSMEEFLEVLDGRINSMANAHALLSRGRWQGVSLAELVHCELAPCVGEGNAVVEGPEVVLAAEATQAVATVLHELVTNAAKYGALSTPHGRVSVHWDWLGNASARQPLVLEWRETGGPAIVAAKKAGYGTSVICDLIPYELGGMVDLVLASEGVRCRVGNSRRLAQQRQPAEPSYQWIGLRSPAPRGAVGSSVALTKILAVATEWRPCSLASPRVCGGGYNSRKSAIFESILRHRESQEH